MNVSATATDEDEVVYSIIKCELQSPEFLLALRLICHIFSGSPAPEGLNFTVGSSTGYLYATGTLDRETFSRYTITVEVINTQLTLYFMDSNPMYIGLCVRWCPK